jgi:hypothetical protein
MVEAEINDVVAAGRGGELDKVGGGIDAGSRGEI